MKLLNLFKCSAAILILVAASSVAAEESGAPTYIFGKVLQCRELFWSGIEAGPVYVVAAPQTNEQDFVPSKSTRSRTLFRFGPSPGGFSQPYLGSEEGTRYPGRALPVYFKNKNTLIQRSHRIPKRRTTYPLQKGEVVALLTETALEGRKSAATYLACFVSNGYSPPIDSQMPKDGKFCVDKCGDGMCAEAVCMAIGCDCAEDKISCPLDCAT